MEADDPAGALQALGELADKNRAEISGLRAEARDVGCRITFQAEFARGKKWPRKFFEGLAKEPAIRMVAIVDEAAVV